MDICEAFSDRRAEIIKGGSYLFLKVDVSERDTNFSVCFEVFEEC